MTGGTDAGGAAPAVRLSLPPLGATPAVSVVIPARDSAATLADAVASALAQEVDGSLEVVIAVGPSRDDTLAVARRLADEDPRVQVVDNPSGRTPAALNVAVAAASGQVVARLDAHATLPPDYLAHAVATLRTAGAANVGGRQVPTASHGFQAAVAAAMRSPVGAGGATYRVGGEAGPVDTVYLGVFRREALDAVGGFDERLIRNQDYELNHRLRAAGGRVWFDPALAVVYRPRATPEALARQYLEYGRWKRVVLRLHPGSLRLRQAIPPIFVLSLGAGVLLGVLGAWLASGTLAWLSWVPLVGLLVAWGTVVVAAAVRAAGASASIAATAAALAVMHVAWGIGFLTCRPRRLLATRPGTTN